MRCIFFLLLLSTLACNPPMPETKNSNRLELVRTQRVKDCQAMLTKESLSWSQFEIFIRAFKLEEELEVWGRTDANVKFKRLAKYDFCASSGTLGPKLKEGDLQIPEGIYHINHFNPKSKFHLSLGINYPNKADLSRADRSAPGSEIYIHGGCATVGCIPITDDKIELLYLLAEQAHNLGQKKIPVHIFPGRMSVGSFKVLRMKNPEQAVFWSQLYQVNRYFERSGRMPQVDIEDDGSYKLIR